MNKNKKLKDDIKFLENMLLDLKTFIFINKSTFTHHDDDTFKYTIILVQSELNDKYIELAENIYFGENL